MGIREKFGFSDEHRASEVGRLFMGGQISGPEYAAGARYANIVLLYLKTTDAPAPYGNEYLGDIADEICLSRKINMAAARQILNDLDRRCGTILDRVAVYEEPLGDGDLPFLRKALKALAGI